MRTLFLLLFIHSILPAQTDLRFEWLNPLPTGIDIRDAKVFSADTFYAVGDAGTFMKTTNGGSTWFVHSNLLGTASRINAMSFINPDTGWVCNDSGKVFRTNDGGVTFTQQLITNSFSLFDVSFVDKDHGWLCADSGYTYRTDNGGQKWMKIYSNYPEPLYSVEFRDKDTGFVCGEKGYLYKTTDGGVTWGLRFTGTINTLRKLSLKADTIFAAGLNGTVILSVNGGLSFSLATVPSAGAALYNIAYAGDGYVYTGTNLGKGFRSTNLGNTWSQLASNTSSLNWLFAADFIAPRTGIIAGRAGTVLRPAPTGDSLRINPRITSETFRAVQNFTGSPVIYAAGLGGIAVKSTNNGQTWTPLTLPSGINTMSAMSFTDPDHGVMVGTNGRVNYTSNGGSSWTPSTFGTARYWGVHIKGKYGFAGNSSGSIIRSTNGGATWSNFSSAGGMYIYGVDIVHDSLAFVATGLQENSIYRSTDFGQTWDLMFNTPIASLFAVRFANDTLGFAAGQKGQFYYTTDRGVQWTKVPLDSNYDYFSIDITNFPQGYMSGTDGKLTGFTMTPSGPVVKDIPSGTMSSLFSISSSKKNDAGGFTIVIAGANGNILRYYDPATSVSVPTLIPAGFTVEQNFPNPFNPATVIRFSLTRAMPVTVSVYDLLGRQVQTLADREFGAGTHQLHWDASALANGVYYYTVRTPEAVVTKKALLLK
ncbi:MAG: T9SS type A sorting domain-containing protein [Bacteroidetes bacterium]|nr:T9SS type A sorting domain-containing protein [Bacteroidota bacterium]